MATIDEASQFDPATVEAGAQFDLRAFNETRILNFIRHVPGCTQQQIARGVGLTRAAVSKLLGDLDEDNPHSDARLRRVLDVVPDRPARYFLARNRGWVMTLDIGSKHIRLRLADLGGTVVAETEFDGEIDVIQQPDRALDIAAELMMRLVDDVGADSADIAGLAIGVPFPVRRRGRVLTSGEWQYEQLPTSLWQRTRWEARPETVVRSDADLGAVAELEAILAERGLGELKRREIDLVYVKWSSSITAAFVTGGELHRGHGGTSSQWPHTPVEVPGEGIVAEECTRCHRICLNSVASVNAIVRTLTAEGAAADLRTMDGEARAKALVRRARGGDARCATLLNTAARTIGSALGGVLNTVNPQFVIIGGAFEATDYSFTSRALHEGVETTYFSEMGKVLIQPGRCTGRAAVEGGLALALRMFAVPYLLERTRLPADLATKAAALKARDNGGEQRSDVTGAARAKSR